MEKLTIITVSHKNYRGLVRLHESILPALDDNIVWIIKDSGKCHDTKRWASNIKNSSIIFSDQPDCGIYNAMNFALNMCDSEFYMIVGSDDSIYTEALTTVKNHLELSSFKNDDVISLPVLINGKKILRKFFTPLCVSVNSLITSHSVGLIIRRSLHQKIGLYDERYKILADSLFVKQAFLKGYRFRYLKTPIMGSFGTTGVSSVNHHQRIIEAYSYNVSLGSPRVLQIIIMIFRLLKYKPASFIE